MPTLRTLPSVWRAWALGFNLVALVGSLLAFYYVHATATLKAAGIAARFAGPESPEVVPFTTMELLQTTHTHLFTMAFLQLMLGGFFLLSSAPAGLKKWLAGGTFALILLDHAAMWATHAWSPSFAPLVLVSGAALGMSLLAQNGWSLWDLTFGYEGK